MQCITMYQCYRAQRRQWIWTGTVRESCTRWMQPGIIWINRKIRNEKRNKETLETTQTNFLLLQMRIPKVRAVTWHSKLTEREVIEMEREFTFSYQGSIFFSTWWDYIFSSSHKPQEKQTMDHEIINYSLW